LLCQGLTPDRLAFTLRVGAACALFPFLGFTTLLTTAVGAALRLNQPVLQVRNQVLGPLQLLLILPQVRLGEWLWRAEASRFGVREMIRAFHRDGLGDFLQRFGCAGVHAFTAWFVTAPLLVLILRFATFPLLRRSASRLSVRT